MADALDELLKSVSARDAAALTHALSLREDFPRDAREELEIAAACLHDYAANHQQVVGSTSPTPTPASSEESVPGPPSSQAHRVEGLKEPITHLGGEYLGDGRERRPLPNTLGAEQVVVHATRQPDGTIAVRDSTPANRSIQTLLNSLVRSDIAGVAAELLELAIKVELIERELASYRGHR